MFNNKGAGSGSETLKVAAGFGIIHSGSVVDPDPDPAKSERAC